MNSNDQREVYFSNRELYDERTWEDNLHAFMEDGLDFPELEDALR